MAGQAVGRLPPGRPGETKGQPKLVDVLSVRPRTRVRFPPPPLFPRTASRARLRRVALAFLLGRAPFGRAIGWSLAERSFGSARCAARQAAPPAIATEASRRDIASAGTAESARTRARRPACPRANSRCSG